MTTLLLLSCLLTSEPANATSNAKSDELTVESAAWLAGRWRNGADDKSLAEEHWTAPHARAMVGMFRTGTADRAGIYELILLEQEADGVWMRLRHFRPQMAPLEQEPQKIKLVKATPNLLVFENPAEGRPKRITYSLAGSELTVTVETDRNGKPASFAIKMTRM